MSEQRIQKFMSSKMYSVLMATVLFWTFDMYWIMVSGWQFLFAAKVVIAISPVFVFIIGRLINQTKINMKKSQRRKDIMFRIYIHRMINKDIA